MSDYRDLWCRERAPCSTYPGGKGQAIQTGAVWGLNPGPAPRRFGSSAEGGGGDWGQYRHMKEGADGGEKAQASPLWCGVFACLHRGVSGFRLITFHHTCSGTTGRRRHLPYWAEVDPLTPGNCRDNRERLIRFQLHDPPDRRQGACAVSEGGSLHPPRPV